MKLAKLRFAQASGTTLDDAGDDAADGIALGLDLRDELLHLSGFFGIGTTHSIGLGKI